jgi:putative tricarboxylic transport membrane protein
MTAEANKTSSRADLIGGVAWTAFGIAVVAGALQMDRLEQFGATLSTAPGLVPGMLGALIGILGLVLVVRSLKAGAISALRTTWAATAEQRSACKRVALATLLSLVYALGLVGRVPFAVATFGFVIVFILAFGADPERPRSFARRAAIAAVVAGLTSASVTLLFEQVFLVRLP